MSYMQAAFFWRASRNRKMVIEKLRGSTVSARNLHQQPVFVIGDLLDCVRSWCDLLEIRPMEVLKMQEKPEMKD
eukprot:6474534-Amphidinium_carterae.1